MKQQPRKELMLDVALRLFNSGGYHNTGVDTIMKESGVSKTTLYKYFPSKEDLILEVLKRRGENINSNVELAIASFSEANPKAPKVQLIGVILTVMNEWVRSENFYGCNFINASAEYGNPHDPIHKLASQHKLARKNRLSDILKPSRPKDAKQLAEKIHLIIEGAIVDAHVSGNVNAVQQATEVIELLLGEIFTL